MRHRACSWASCPSSAGNTGTVTLNLLALLKHRTVWVSELYQFPGEATTKAMSQVRRSSCCVSRYPFSSLICDTNYFLCQVQEYETPSSLSEIKAVSSTLYSHFPENKNNCRHGEAGEAAGSLAGFVLPQTIGSAVTFCFSTITSLFCAWGEEIKGCHVPHTIWGSQPGRRALEIQLGTFPNAKHNLREDTTMVP